MSERQQLRTLTGRINFPRFWGITELHPIARPMSLLLKPSQAGKCESASLNDLFHTLIPLHPYISEWCRMTRSASRRWRTMQTQNVTPSLQISTLVIMYWSNNPRPISWNPCSTPNPTSSCRRRAAWSQPKISHTTLSAAHRTSGASQSICLYSWRRGGRRVSESWDGPVSPNTLFIMADTAITEVPSTALIKTPGFSHAEVQEVNSHSYTRSSCSYTRWQH